MLHHCLFSLHPFSFLTQSSLALYPALRQIATSAVPVLLPPALWYHSLSVSLLNINVSWWLFSHVSPSFSSVCVLVAYSMCLPTGSAEEKKHSQPRRTTQAVCLLSIKSLQVSEIGRKWHTRNTSWSNLYTFFQPVLLVLIYPSLNWLLTVCLQ